MRKAMGRARCVWTTSARTGAVAGLVLLSLGACSSSRDGGSSTGLYGNDRPNQAAGQQGGATSTSGYDSDGPPTRSAEPVYRGGRDPVSGRAAEWPPAGPAGGTQTAAGTPPPQPGYGSPGYPTQQQPYPPQGYPQQQGYEPQPGYPQQSGYGQPPHAPGGYLPPPRQPYPPQQGYQSQSGYEQPGAPVGGGPLTVQVRRGDTLFRIARAHNVTVAELMQANGLQSQTIREGQRLTIPAR